MWLAESWSNAVVRPRKVTSRAVPVALLNVAEVHDETVDAPYILDDGGGVWHCLTSFDVWFEV
jgi:hypothetical protein